MVVFVICFGLFISERKDFIFILVYCFNLQFRKVIGNKLLLSFLLKFDLVVGVILFLLIMIKFKCMIMSLFIELFSDQYLIEKKRSFSVVVDVMLDFEQIDGGFSFDDCFGQKIEGQIMFEYV